jgi:hypothetical protein
MIGQHDRPPPRALERIRKRSIVSVPDQRSPELKAENALHTYGSICEAMRLLVVLLDNNLRRHRRVDGAEVRVGAGHGELVRERTVGVDRA